MNAVIYSRIVGAFFTVIAIVHTYRLVSFFPIQLGSFSVPYGASWVGLVAAGTLGVVGFRARA